MNRILYSLLIAFSLTALNAAALPMTKAKQVSIDNSSMTTVTGSTVQTAIEQIDARVGDASTGTVGVVQFATPAEVSGGTESGKVVSPADLTSSMATYGMHYSGASVFTGSMPTSWSDLDLSGTIGSNRCFIHLQIIPDSDGVEGYLRPNGETVTGGFTAGVPVGTAVFATGTGGSGDATYISLITDASGVIEWKANKTGSGSTVVRLLSYQILIGD